MKDHIQRGNYLSIDKIINDENIYPAEKIAQLKIIMNNIDDVIPFRREATKSEIIKFENEGIKIYTDLMGIEDECVKINKGVDAVIKLKTFKKEVHKIKIIAENNFVICRAIKAEELLDEYLKTVYTQACGITF